MNQVAPWKDKRMPMRRAPLLRATLIALVTLATAACGGDSTDTEAASSAPRTTPAVTGAAPSEDIRVAGTSAAEFYRANCAVCHGAQLQGGVGPALTVASLAQGEAAYIDAIANGVPGTAMVSWTAAGLTMEDVEALVAWLHAGAPD